MGVSVFDERKPLLGAYNFTNDTALLQYPVFLYDKGDFRCDWLFASSNDTVDRDFVIVVSSLSLDDYVLGVVTVPAGAGSGGVPLVDVFLALGYTPGSLALTSSAQIEANAVEAVTAGKTVTIFAFGGAL